MRFIFEEEALFYDMVGKGHPIIILHAMGTDHRSMKAWLEPVFQNEDGFQRIYIDIPAHGQSTCNNIQSTEEMRRIILAFIDEVLFEKPFSLIGHSYGGYIAQGMLSARAHQVAGICLLAPAVHLKERILPEKVVREKDKSSLASVNPDVRTAFETLLVYQTKENLRRFLQEVQPGRLLADKTFLQSNWRERGYFFNEKPFENLSKLEQPALVICGKQDSICGYKDHIFLLDKLPNLTFVVLDQAGHLITIEKREMVQSLVSDWLRKV
ncbi:alpha/beta fold hydrolase [Bacillus sp. FJAT-29814]|uniref:alpha/beta fold hydrolase n=1 Tax=Bacillus sp. FJAT-29814 TaxID=1729688 RepID=UPI00082B1F3C|nr:alpha/beta hydrolase [Bacillus sp. FJAT-29814]